MFIELILLSLGILFIAFLAMGARVFFTKKGKFPDSSIGKNKELRKRGIICAKHEEIHCRRQIDRAAAVDSTEGCAGCSHS